MATDVVNLRQLGWYSRISCTEISFVHLENDSVKLFMDILVNCYLSKGIWQGYISVLVKQQVWEQNTFEQVFFLAKNEIWALNKIYV